MPAYLRVCGRTYLISLALLYVAQWLTGNLESAVKHRRHQLGTNINGLPSWFLMLSSAGGEIERERNEFCSPTHAFLRASSAVDLWKSHRAGLIIAGKVKQCAQSDSRVDKDLFGIGTNALDRKEERAREVPNYISG